jgi:hypothetical protein
VVLLVSYVCTLPYLASLPAHLQAELGFLLVVPFPLDQSWNGIQCGLHHRAGKR